MAAKKAPVNAKTAGRLIASAPGRRMTRVPQKPTAIAVQRRTRTTSLRISAAAAVAKSGVVKVSAVASARGMRVTAVNPNNMAETPVNARSACCPRCRVLKLSHPMVTIHGTMQRNPKKNRKNPI